MFVNYANRGKSFEKLIDMSNTIYYQKNIANIQKIETPVHVQSIDKSGKIRYGWFKKKSTVDYKGVFDGKAVAFDAKSTRNRTRFPLSEVKQHQLEDLQKWHNCGGKSFILVEFSKHHEIYLLPFKELSAYKLAAKNGGRKSIPYHDFLTMFEQVKSSIHVPVDYLRALQKG